MYLNGRDVRILGFRREGKVSCDFWETTFDDHHLQSSVANDWGKKYPRSWCQTLCRTWGSPCIVFRCLLFKTCHMKNVHLVVNNVCTWQESEDPRFSTQGRSLLWFLGDTFLWSPPWKFSCQWLRKKYPRSWRQTLCRTWGSPMPYVSRCVVKPCHIRCVHLLWTMFPNGQNLRTLDFRCEVYVFYDSWETTFH